MQVLNCTGHLVALQRKYRIANAINPTSQVDHKVFRDRHKVRDEHDWSDSTNEERECYLNIDKEFTNEDPEGLDVAAIGCVSGAKWESIVARHRHPWRAWR